MNQRVDSLKDEKIDKAVGNLIKKGKKKCKIHTIRNEKCEMTTNSLEIQKMINTYFKNIWVQLQHCSTKKQTHKQIKFNLEFFCYLRKFL